VSFAVVKRVLPTDRNDARISSDVKEKLRINLTRAPNHGDVFAEARWQNFDPLTGNALVIVPVVPEVLVGPTDTPAT
jgi:hypothetical protein